VLVADVNHGRVWVREGKVRRVVVRDLMRYMRRRWCSHWTVCKWSCSRVRDASSSLFEMILSGGSVRRLRREVGLAMVDPWGAPVRLMTMGRMSTSMPGQ
jgi:hypothetical protein